MHVLALLVPPQDGASPIFLAASKGHVEVIKVLMEAKADPDAKDNVRISSQSHPSFQGPCVRVSEDRGCIW